MALAKDITFKGIDLSSAYHKITRAEVVAEGSGTPQLSCVISAYRNKADADLHINELSRTGYNLGDFDKSDPRAAAAIAYEKVKALNEYASAADV